MAYFVADKSVLALTFRGRLFAQTVMTTFNYQINGVTGGSTSGEARLDGFYTRITAAGDMVADYKAVMPTAWLLEGVELQWLAPIRYVKKTYLSAVGFGGGGDTTTTNNSCAVEFRGDTANRRSISVKKLPGLGGSNVVDGIIDGAYLDLAGALMAQHLADVVDGVFTFKPVIYGRLIVAQPAHVPPIKGQPELITPITAGFVHDTARVMRRRTVGVGI